MTRFVEASAVVPLSREEMWELFEGDQMCQVVELSDSIIAIEDYKMRSDGTPRYVHVGKMGPAKMRFTADYSVFEPPRRIPATVLDSPFGGDYRVDYEAVPGGTRVTHHWEAVSKNPFFGLLLPIACRLIERSLQQDLETIAWRASPGGLRGALRHQATRRNLAPPDPYSPNLVEEEFSEVRIQNLV